MFVQMYVCIFVCKTPERTHLGVASVLAKQGVLLLAYIKLYDRLVVLTSGLGGFHLLVFYIYESSRTHIRVYSIYLGALKCRLHIADVALFHRGIDGVV